MMAMMSTAKPFNFPRSIERWMSAAMMIPDVRRLLFIRKFHTLLVARGADWNPKALQSAMDVLLRFQDEGYPSTKTSQHLAHVTLAITIELGTTAASYTTTRHPGNDDYSCPGHGRVVLVLDDIAVAGEE
jgi:hypothetical protein